MKRFFTKLIISAFLILSSISALKAAEQTDTSRDSAEQIKNLKTTTLQMTLNPTLPGWLQNVLVRGIASE